MLVAYPFSRGTSQPRIELVYPILQVDSLHAELPEKHLHPLFTINLFQDILGFYLLSHQYVLTNMGVNIITEK